MIVRVKPGAISVWTGGKSGGGSAPFDLSALPWEGRDPMGGDVDPDAFRRRYLGGNPDNDGGFPPGLGGAETYFTHALSALVRAEAENITLPSGLEWAPGEWATSASDGRQYPSRMEIDDLAHVQGGATWIKQVWRPVDLAGTSADNPMTVPAHSCDLYPNKPRYFTDKRPGTGETLYYDQGACKAEISYSDDYPHVFGEPGQAPTPAPPKPEPPKPEPPKPEPPKPPTADPLAPFFSWVREWPRGLGQRAAVRQFLDWASPKVSGAPVEVLAYLESAASSWPDNRKDVVKAYLAFVRGKIGGAPPVPEPTPTPIPTPPGEGLTLYRKDGEVYNSASNPRGIIMIPVPRTLRLKKLQVEMDFTRGPHNPKKPTGAIGLMWLHSKGTVRPNNWIGNLNVLPRNLKLQTKVDIAKGSGLEVETLPAILSEGSRHLSYTYDAGDRATVVIGPHTLSVKSTARNGILEIPKGNLTLEIGHDVAKDTEEGTPESSSPPGWTAGNLVVTGVE